MGSEADHSFEEFVRGRSTHLFRLALVLTGWNEAAAQDLLQIALERAYRRWLLFRHGDSADPDPDPPPTPPCRRSTSSTAPSAAIL